MLKTHCSSLKHRGRLAYINADKQAYIYIHVYIYKYLSCWGLHVWRLWCPKQVSRVGRSNCNRQCSVGCNYLSLPEIPVSGTEAHVYTCIYQPFVKFHEDTGATYQALCQPMSFLSQVHLPRDPFAAIIKDSLTCHRGVPCHWVNILWTEWNGRHFADDGCNLGNDSLAFVPRCQIDNKSLSWVQVMTWCHAGTKPLTGPMLNFHSMQSLGTRLGVTWR